MIVPSCFQECCILMRQRDVILGQNVGAASCKCERLINYIFFNNMFSKILEINEFHS
jgi:hypothetical protein